jgi:hypothetical protein
VFCTRFNKLLPVNSNQKYNAYLKEIAEICGIKKTLTSHMARHTFATTVTLSNGVPLETVSKMLGHTKLSTTQIYAKVLDTKVSHDMGALKSILAKQNHISSKSKDDRRPKDQEDQLIQRQLRLPFFLLITSFFLLISQKVDRKRLRSSEIKFDTYRGTYLLTDFKIEETTHGVLHYNC